jgi:hypothetical protein
MTLGTPFVANAPNVTSATLIGQDVAPRKGMYALRNQGVSVVTFNNLTEFESKQIVAEPKSWPLNGPPIFLMIPDGWDGSFDLDRADSNADSFFASQEALYYAGFPIVSATINETIANPDGSLSQFMYVGVVLTLEDAGKKKGDDLVKMKVKFKASTRTQIL